MKKVMLITGAVILITAGSCSKSYDSGSGNNNNNSGSGINSYVASGSWTVGSFREKTEDKTASFSGIVFVFAANGTVTATLGGTVTNGTWSSSPAIAADPYYGTPGSPATFTLNLGSSGPYDKLKKTWNVNTASSSDIKLDHPQASEDEHVEFVK